jgi:hypothetical protein
MSDSNPVYRQIAATSWISRFLPGMRSALYLAEDHLLLATQMIIFERYHRFFFSDIEAIVAAKSNRWIWVSVLWALCIPFSLLWYLGQTQWCYVVGACCALGTGTILIWNLLAGPTYIVKIQTSAQTRRLKAVERAPKYETFQRAVIPLALSAQQSQPLSAIAP